MKILHITDTLGMGGAETWMMNLLRLWATEGGPQCHFLMTSGNRGIFDEEAERLGAKLYYSRFSRRTIGRFAHDFRTILREGRYDVLHDHQAYPSGWHFLIGHGVLPPVRVTHVHNPFYQVADVYGVSVSRRIAGLVGKHLISAYATAIAGTSWSAIQEHGFLEPEFKRVPKFAAYCGFSPESVLGDIDDAKTQVSKEFGWPANAKVILFAGRLDPSHEHNHPHNHKNSRFAVDVVLEAIAQSPDVRALFVGKQSAALPFLKHKVKAAGAGEKVHFAGIRHDLVRLMLASDVLLFPSRAEGLGMVAVEAQASGLPVLASEAVPAECLVIPEKVRFQSLNESPAKWATSLLDLISSERDMVASNELVKLSPFAIRNSAMTLERIYRGSA